MTTTDHDIRAQVREVLTDYAGLYDIPAIANEIVQRYGLVDVNDVPDFWVLIARHEKPGQRPAYPAETCTCGRPAVTVYQTARFGDVPYCGIPDGGQNLKEY